MEVLTPLTSSRSEAAASLLRKLVHNLEVDGMSRTVLEEARRLEAELKTAPADAPAPSPPRAPSTASPHPLVRAGADATVPRASAATVPSVPPNPVPAPSVDGDGDRKDADAPDWEEEFVRKLAERRRLRAEELRKLGLHL